VKCQISSAESAARLLFSWRKREEKYGKIIKWRGCETGCLLLLMEWGGYPPIVENFWKTSLLFSLVCMAFYVLLRSNKK